MGGYGLYVWGSYVVTAFALAAEVWLVVRRGRYDRTTQQGSGRSGRGEGNADQG